MVYREMFKGVLGEVSEEDCPGEMSGGSADIRTYMDHSRT